MKISERILSQKRLDTWARTSNIESEGIFEHNQTCIYIKQSKSNSIVAQL